MSLRWVRKVPASLEVAPRSLAPITLSGDDSPVAVLAVFAVIVVWRYAVKGKGNGAARLAALLSALIVSWVLIALYDASSAGSIALDFAKGIGQAAAGLGHFLGQF